MKNKTYAFPLILKQPLRKIYCVNASNLRNKNSVDSRVVAIIKATGLLRFRSIKRFEKVFFFSSHSTMTGRFGRFFFFLPNLSPNPVSMFLHLRNLEFVSEHPKFPITSLLPYLLNKLSEGQFLIKLEVFKFFQGYRLADN